MSEPLVFRLFRTKLHDFTLHQVGDDLQSKTEIVIFG